MTEGAGVLLLFATWAELAQHLHHRGLTPTEPACYFMRFGKGEWAPEQDLNLCTCGLKDIIGKVRVHP